MLALQGEQEGAELVMRNEGHGSGEEPGRQPSRTLRPLRGESGMLRQQAMEQGRFHSVGGTHPPRPLV